MLAWTPVCMLLICASLVHAESVVFEDVVLPQERDGLTLYRAGLLRKGVVFRIYTAALYLEKADDAARVLEDVPKRLDIHFYHNTPKARMIAVAEQTLQNNLSSAAYAALHARLEALHQAYRDGYKGACASLVYRPGEGTTYLFNEEPLITLEGVDFAAEYFSIWLGTDPASKSVKSQLLPEKRTTP